MHNDRLARQALEMKVLGYLRVLGISIICSGLAACGTSLPPSTSDEGHLIAPVQPENTDIPSVVTPLPLVLEPSSQDDPELYTIVAQDVPVRELMFTMARDSGVNIDVNPDITGQVSINAIDQSLPQILERISRQINMRWREDENGNLIVEQDSAYWKNYTIDYVNVERSATTQADVSTSIGSVAGADSANTDNNSSASISQTSDNNFWETLVTNLEALLIDESTVASEISPIVANPESGVISVSANARQHEEVQNFINFVLNRSLQQVLIEATVVEVSLNDQYQSGVDWSTVGRNNDQISFVQNLTSPNLSGNPSSVLTIDRSNTPDAISATISLLSQFGELRVLSSPKIMALNNQAAMLRVVDNRVYFTIDVQPGIPASGVSVGTPPVYTTTVHTVPVGFVMTVTPQISDDDQITLNVRPTISRIVRFVNDPSPILAESGVVNSIPEIQIREIESILKVNSGQIAVLGGLMQDTLSNDVDGLPGLSRVPGLGGLFGYRNETASKTELIVFIRPVVVRQPSLTGDFQQYSEYLPANGLEFNSTPFGEELPFSLLNP